MSATERAIAAYDDAINAELGNPPGSVFGDRGRALLHANPAIAAMLAAHRAAVIEELAVLAETWPFGRDKHHWQTHERRDFGRWLREQTAPASSPPGGPAPRPTA